MQWLELTIHTTPQVIDLVAASLTMLGFDSFIMDDETDFNEFLEENRQYWDYVDEELSQSMAGISQIRLYLEDGPQAPEQISYLRSALDDMKKQYADYHPGALTLHCENVRDEDWENNWKQYYQPIPIGDRLLVVPMWLEPENLENRVQIRLDPGMIFGTGAHASTQMCMMELETFIKGGERVIDLGSGSGILSITALLLGAASAIGVDIDPKAEDIARENAAINSLLGDRFTACTGDVINDQTRMQALSAVPYDIVLANIVADVIIPLAPVIPHFLKPDGLFICSGILNTRLDEVKKAITAVGLQILSIGTMDDWCCITAKKG